ncbi:MAG TPA: hypothetical protein VM204_01575 [Gaiellaceae bacterium]|nr:hypothetical protein [Gaiellaceae bacterium]
MLQTAAGLAPLAFIVATSVVIGPIPAAVDAGLDSPEWRGLRDALLVTGGLFLLQQLLAPLQWSLGEILAWRVDDRVREADRTRRLRVAGDRGSRRASAREVARETGGIAIFASHRFSTVRMADLIVVLDGGRVADHGTHAELVARGGLYAELYALQAAAYG